MRWIARICKDRSYRLWNAILELRRLRGANIPMHEVRIFLSGFSTETFRSTNNRFLNSIVGRIPVGPVQTFMKSMLRESKGNNQSKNRIMPFYVIKMQSTMRFLCTTASRFNRARISSWTRHLIIAWSE